MSKNSINYFCRYKLTTCLVDTCTVHGYYVTLKSSYIQYWALKRDTYIINICICYRHSADFGIPWIKIQLTLSLTLTYNNEKKRNTNQAHHHDLDLSVFVSLSEELFLFWLCTTVHRFPNAPVKNSCRKIDFCQTDCEVLHLLQFVRPHWFALSVLFIV